jgi:hypothetical protein
VFFWKIYTISGRFQDGRYAVSVEDIDNCRQVLLRKRRGIIFGEPNLECKAYTKSQRRHIEIAVKGRKTSDESRSDRRYVQIVWEGEITDALKASLFIKILRGGTGQEQVTISQIKGESRGQQRMNTKRTGQRLLVICPTIGFVPYITKPTRAEREYMKPRK